MASTRISRLTRIASFRAFQNWSDDGQSDTFKRLNVIYGVNGSGKSTLAHLLRAAADGELDDGVALELAGITGTRSIQIRRDSTDFWQCVRVFSEKYVAENLRFDDVNGPSPDSLLTLGEVNVANEAELEGAKSRRDAAREELRDASADLKAKTQRLEKRRSAVAADIVRDLAGSGIREYRATNVYNRSNVIERLSSAEAAAEPESDIGEDLKLALAPRPEQLAAPTNRVAQVKSLSERASGLLGRSVTSAVLDELREPTRSHWVQQGLHLHEDARQCLFCGGAISDERRSALEGHFDDALTQLQGQIDVLIADIETSVEAVEEYRRSCSSLKSNYSSVQAPLREAIDAYHAQASSYREACMRLIRDLATKRTNPFPPIHTSHLPSSRTRSILSKSARSSWSESNSASLHQTQSASERPMQAVRKYPAELRAPGSVPLLSGGWFLTPR